jgi:hypothetical protein
MNLPRRNLTIHVEKYFCIITKIKVLDEINIFLDF